MEVYLFQKAGSHEWNGSHGTDRWLAASETTRPRTRGLDVKHRMWQPKTVDFMNNDGFITNITADFWGPTSFRSDCFWLPTQCCTEWSMVNCGSQTSRARGVGGLISHKFCIYSAIYISKPPTVMMNYGMCIWLVGKPSCNPLYLPTRSGPPVTKL